MQTMILLRFFVPYSVLLLGFCGAFFFWLQRDSFWLDEIIAQAHTLQPLPSFFIQVIRNDIHPFFYFLLLKGWSVLCLESDQCMIASSLIGALLSASVVFLIAKRVFGLDAAVWAVAVFVALPLFTYASGNLRMYGIMPGMALACWYANREYLRTSHHKWLPIIFVLQLAFAYTHAIAFFFLFFIVLAAFVDQFQNLDKSRFLKWLVLQAICFLFFSYVVVSALIRGTETLPVPGFDDFVLYPAKLIVPWEEETAFDMAFGLAVFSLLVVLSFRDVGSALLVIIVPILALVTSLIISAFGKPMFKPPVFQASLIPFLAMGAGVGIASLRSKNTVLATTIVLCLSLGYSYFWVFSYDGVRKYKDASDYLVSNAASNDVVIVPHIYTYWGILRYSVAPDWGEPLSIRPLTDNPEWHNLKNRLGPDLTELLGLNPESDFIESGGVKYVIGSKVAHHTADAQNIWLVLLQRPDQYFDMAPYSVVSERNFGNIKVLRARQLVKD